MKIKKKRKRPPKMKLDFMPAVIAFPPRPYFRFSLKPDRVSVSGTKYFLFAPH
jgi:hypothetical protein